jgi:hypothetical protein
MAKELGLLADSVTLLTDTTPVKGAGAVMDTFTLIRKGVRKLLKKLGFSPKQNKKMEGAIKSLIEKYVESDKKADINWDDKRERDGHLQDLVEDAKSILEYANEEMKEIDDDNKEVEGSIYLLTKIIEDNIVKNEKGESEIKKGVTKDRTISVTDPEMRHGRKSSSKVISGFKTSVSIDAESELILDIHDIKANESDGKDLIPTIKDVEKNTGVEVTKVLGDGIYGTGENRQKCAEELDHPVDLVSPLSSSKDPEVDKKSFDIDLEKGTAICPNGIQVNGIEKTDKENHTYWKFEWQRKQCQTCPLFERCVKSKEKGRSVVTHVQEKYFQEAREQQQSPEWKVEYNIRANIERKIAELARQGLRNTRYIDSKKRRLQRLMTGAVANLKRFFSNFSSYDLIKKMDMLPQNSS